MKFTLTKHAKERMQERGINAKQIAWAMKGKPRAHREHAHKTVYHGPKQVNGKAVFVVADGMKVLTAYYVG